MATSGSTSRAATKVVLLALFASPSLGEVWSIKDLGMLNGTRVGRVTEFYAIPYGAANRFEQSTPYGSWGNVRDATEVGPECLQGGLVGGPLKGLENCLTLDVRSCNKNGLVPVMVWIHGGGLVSGSSTQNGLYNGTSLVEHSDCGVVFVSLQYRLGIWGFFDHPSFPHANFGFRDQQLALHWVQSFIHGFGGDRTRVTIFGESAGGASVAMHLASPLSKGLFGAAIAESTWTAAVTGNKPRSMAQRYGALCGNAACPGKTSSELLKCLQGENVSALVASNQYCGTYQPWVTVDGLVLDQPVWKTVREGTLATVPIIVGGQANEWDLWPVVGLNMSQMLTAELAMELDIDYVSVSTNSTAAQEVSMWLQHGISVYPAADHPDKYPGVSGQQTDFFTDLAITCVTDQMTRNHNAAAYRYLFSQPGKFVNGSRGLFKELELLAYHTLELNYVYSNFDHAYVRGTELVKRDEDITLSAAIQDYWVSMAMLHKPTSKFSNWPLANSHPKKMLEFAAPATPRIQSIDFRVVECTRVVEMMDAAFL